MNLRRVLVLLLLCLIAPASAAAQEDTYNGSQLWLRYVPVPDAERYRATVANVVVENATANPVYRHTPTLAVEAGGTERLVRSSLEAAREELTRGLSGLLGTSIAAVETPTAGSVVVGTRESSPTVAAAIPAADLIASEGYVIRTVGSRTIIAGRLSWAAFQIERALRRHGLLDLAPRIADRGVATAFGAKFGLILRQHGVERRIAERLGPADGAF
jgi:alpha-glucuronidase